MQGTEFYEAAVNKLVPQLGKCPNFGAGCVEK
jgi:hypothetical protein